MFGFTSQDVGREFAQKNGVHLARLLADLFFYPENIKIKNLYRRLVLGVAPSSATTTRDALIF